MNIKKLEKELLKKRKKLSKLSTSHYVVSTFNKGDMMISFETGFYECMNIILPMLEESKKKEKNV